MALTLVLLLAFDAPRSSAEREDEFPEYQLKSAFLYNFAKFITWPGKAFAQADTPMTIGIVGNDPFNGLLAETVKGKTVNGRLLAIKRFNRTDDLKDCHILFISRSEKEYLGTILASVKGAPVLTVSEVDRFAHSGGMINFVVVSQSVRFEINLQMAEGAGLQVSSKLWGVGVVVKGDKK